MKFFKSVLYLFSFWWWWNIHWRWKLNCQTWFEFYGFNLISILHILCDIWKHDDGHEVVLEIFKQILGNNFIKHQPKIPHKVFTKLIILFSLRNLTRCFSSFSFTNSHNMMKFTSMICLIFFRKTETPYIILILKLCNYTTKNQGNFVINSD